MFATMVARGTLAGAVIGLLDAVDTVAGGFTGALPFGLRAGVVGSAMMLWAALGTVIGAGCAVPASIPRLRRLWPAPHRLLAGLALALAATTAALGWGLRMFFVVPPYQIGVGALVAGGTIAVLSIRGRSEAVLSGALWLVLFGWCYWIGARLLYSFSRHGVATDAHAAWAIGLCVLAIVILSVSPFARRVALRSRWAAASVAGAALLLALAGPLLARTPHALRLVLYERTSFTYRLLATLPHPALTAERLASRCAPVTTVRHNARTEAGTDHDAPPLRGVVLVMVDALRSDRVPSAHTPRLSALAANGYRFDRAYTTRPVTRYAIAAMLTGRAAAWRGGNKARASSFRRALGTAGIRTIAVSAHSYLAAAAGDFDVYDQLTPHGVPANRETLESKAAFEHARRHLDELDASERFFLLVHFYDPHAQYVTNPLFPGGASLEERYDGEVAYADHYIGLLLDDLERRSHGDIAVIVVGDHGEEHWEHRYHWHRARIYEESVRVPLILRVPSMPGAAVIHRLVSVMDVAPTILDLFHLPVPSDRDGVSLLTTLRATSPDQRALFLASDIYPTYGIVQGEQKVIVNLQTGILEHYDLSHDPDERDNLADQDLPVFRELECRIADQLRR